MTPHSKRWFEDALRRGVDPKVAYFGTEVIDSWIAHWNHKISLGHLEKMTLFALSFPEAALHRWSIIAGPHPWMINDSLLDSLKENPKFSVCDSLEKQNVKVYTRDIGKSN